MIKFNDIIEYHGEGSPNLATEFLKGQRGLVTEQPVRIGKDIFLNVSFEDGGMRFVNAANVKLIK